MIANINFSENWNNKLNSRFFFSTIRAAGQNKYKEGDVVSITHRQYYMGNAQIVSIVEKEGNELTDLELSLDTGKSKEEGLKLLSKIYGSGVLNKRFIVMLLKWA